MKKVNMILIGLFAFTAATAQITKGCIFVGASTNFGYNNLSPDNSSGFTIATLDAKAGYFFVNNLQFGLNLNYYKIDDISETGIGAYGRYYIQGKIFVGAGITSIKPEGGDATIEIPIEVGYAFFIVDNISIEPRLGYAMGDGYERFGLNIGFGLYFNR